MKRLQYRKRDDGTHSGSKSLHVRQQDLHKYPYKSSLTRVEQYLLLYTTLLKRLALRSKFDTKSTLQHYYVHSLHSTDLSYSLNRRRLLPLASMSTSKNLL